MPTPLRYDLDYLKRLVTHAINLHKPRSTEEATMLADIRDYFMYLALDGLEDPALARTLVDRFTALQAWLGKQLAESPFWPTFGPETRFYLGWLFGLEQLLSLRHAIALLPAEKISRQDFMRSWVKTAKALGLS